MPDADAKDAIPDLMVHHVVAGEFDKPTAQDIRDYHPNLNTPRLQENHLEYLKHQYSIRAGIWVISRHCFLIGEIKPFGVPSNFQEKSDPLFPALPLLAGMASKTEKHQLATEQQSEISKLEMWWGYVRLNFSRAVNQVMYYCAVHFSDQNNQHDVVVLPAVGPYWYWGWVSREEVPAYDWMTGDVKDTPEDHWKSVSFRERFEHSSTSHYILETEESHTQFKIICDQILSKANSITTSLTLPTKYNFRLLKEEPSFHFCP